MSVKQREEHHQPRIPSKAPNRESGGEGGHENPLTELRECDAPLRVDLDVESGL